MTDDQIALAIVRRRGGATELIKRAAAMLALKPLGVAEEEFGSVLDQAMTVDHEGAVAKAYMTVFREEWEKCQ